MAVSEKVSQDNIQSLLSQGVPQELITNYGNKLNPDESQRILSSFRASGNPYGANNINGVLTNPSAPPDYNDPLGYRARLESEVGLTDARTRSLNAMDTIRKFDQGSLAQQNYIEGQTIKQGVITGMQANQARLRGQERTSLVDEAEAAQDFLLAKQAEVDNRYNIFNEQRDTMQQLILNNPGANIKFTDTIEAASTKLEAYAAKAKKEAYKDKLKEIALQMGISTKGKSTKALEKKIAKTNKKALKVAQQESELKLESLRMDIANTKSLIAERGKGGSKAVSPQFQTNLQSGLAAITRGEKDGYIDPAQYRKWATDALANAKNEQEFKAATDYINAAYNLLNPSDIK